MSSDIKANAPQKTSPDSKVKESPVKDNSAKPWRQGQVYSIKYTWKHKKGFSGC